MALTVGETGHFDDHETSVLTVAHGSDATVSRPTLGDGSTAALRVLWSGTVEPNNDVAGDVLLRTDQDRFYRSDGTNWVGMPPADAAAGTASLRTLGTGAQQATPGDHPAAAAAHHAKTTSTDLEDGGSDEMSVAGLSGALADQQTPTIHPHDGTAGSGGTVAHGVTTGQTAADHHAKTTSTDLEPGGSDPLAVDAAAGTGSLRTLGGGAQQAAPGTGSGIYTHVVTHRLDETVARPAGASRVAWIGSVPPRNRTADDDWVDEALRIDFNPTAGSTLTVPVLNYSGPAPTWEIEGATYQVEEPTHTWVADGPHLVRVLWPDGADALTALRLSATSVSGDLSAVAPLTSLTNLQLQNTSVSGDLAAVSPLTSLTFLHLANTSVSGDLAAVSPLTSLTFLSLASTSVSGDLAAVSPLTSLTALQLQSTSVSGDLAAVDWTGVAPGLTDGPLLAGTQATGVLPAGLFVDTSRIWVHDLALGQVDVDATIDSIYQARANYNDPSPALNIGGTNAAPSGTYQDPGGAPTSGKEKIFVLENNPDGEGFNTWTITYTA